MSEEISKTGTLTEIIFRNDDNAYTVAVFQFGDEYTTCVGYFHAPKIGGKYNVKGDYKFHPSYGPQLEISEIIETPPETEEDLIAFLAYSGIKGIGFKMAKAIVNHFGKETLLILEKNPERLMEISGIGKKKAGVIAEEFRNQHELASCFAALKMLGIGENQAMKIYKLYGKEAPAIVEENPYRLVRDVRGFGFVKADSIAMNVGIKKDSPFRIKSGLLYMLSQEKTEGNTFIPRKELLDKGHERLDVATEEIDDAIIELAYEGRIKIEVIENREVCYLFDMFVEEKNISCKLIELRDSELKMIYAEREGLIRMIEADEKMLGISLSPKQRKAILSSLNSGVSIITGGPGTGKTTIIRCIIEVLHSANLKVAIAAPTGRAAKRITETSGFPASTVHRLLEYQPVNGAGFMSFGKTGADPLDFDAVVVDEASMIDQELMNGLIEAIRPGTRLVIVGDADQLPSVGAGNVLRDIIESEMFDVSFLTEIFRQGRESFIVSNAHLINRGEYPNVNCNEGDFFFMERKTEKEISDLIVELATGRLSGYYENISDINDIQILTPVKRGKVGTIALNRRLQEFLNPFSGEENQTKYGEKIFRVGDKVMQTRNNYSIEWMIVNSGVEGEGIFNGDIGFINGINKEDGYLSILFDDEKLVTYDFTDLDELELAYAITVHKSQGSEFPVIIIPMTWFPPQLANRNLLYTAVTRAKKLVVICGSKSCMNHMIDNNSIKKRYSGLKERIVNISKMKEDG